jgi:hypothetical protein
MVKFVPNDAEWINPVVVAGAPTIEQPTLLNSKISWGTPLNVGGSQSSYEISAFDTAPVDVTPGFNSAPFDFADFTHFNFPLVLGSGKLTQVQLMITGHVFADAIDLGPKMFVLDFYHDETNNAGPCPYGGANFVGINSAGCADLVVNVFNYDSDKFQIGGVDYYFDPYSFEIGGVDAPAFLTKENAANPAILKAQFVTVAALPAYPEPATWALMIGGFALVGASLRRSRANMVTATICRG